MSQHNSSMISNGGPNSDLKYQKALKQISKLIHTNKILKSESDQKQQILGSQLHDIAMRYEQINKKYEILEHQKLTMQRQIEGLQDANNDLTKQYQIKQREVGYLNDVLAQQNAQLQKLSAFKDEKGISELFRSYQQRQLSYKEEISRLEEHVSTLKSTIDTLQIDIIQEKQMHHRYEQQYNIMSLQIKKYRDLNNYLINQNEAILTGSKRDDNYNRNKQVESFVFEFKKQLDNLRNIKFEAQDVGERQYKKNYELLLEQKNNISLLLAKTRDQLQISQTKIKQMYEMQEKMSSAVSRSEMLIQENNILKNRITILESKDIIDSAGFSADSEFKDFEDKINFMMNKSDPLARIKNGDDNSLFITMKSFITDLQRKIQLITDQRESLDKKYKIIKMKFQKKAEENIIFDQNNKLLKGKVQGYERLTEKLNYQLERSMHAHEDQIVKMVAITNNLVGRKIQQSKTTSAFIKEQFDLEIQKSERVQKSLSQELQYLRLQKSTLKIKISDIEAKLQQSNEFIQIYQGKIEELTERQRQIQKQNGILTQNLLKYEQLYGESKLSNETALIQKQQLTQRLNILTEELKEKTYKLQEQPRIREENYVTEIRRMKADNTRIRQEYEILNNQYKRHYSELQQRRLRDQANIDKFKHENEYYSEIEVNYNQLKFIHNQLQTELNAIKVKTSNIDNLHGNIAELQSQTMKKTDELNDEKRLNITLRKDVENLQEQKHELNEVISKLTGQMDVLRGKLYQTSSNESFSSKQMELRRMAQKMVEQMAVLESVIRDEKRNCARYMIQIQSFKDQNERLNEIIIKNKSKQQQYLSVISQTHDDVEKIQEQLEGYKLKHSQNNNIVKNLNLRINQANQANGLLNQELTNSYEKLSILQKILRSLTTIKQEIGQAEKIIKRLSSVDRLQWEQQRQKEGLSTLVDKLHRIIKNSENYSTNDIIAEKNTTSFVNFEGDYSIAGKSHLGQHKINQVTHDTYENSSISGNYDSYRTHTNNARSQNFEYSYNERL